MKNAVSELARRLDGHALADAFQLYVWGNPRLVDAVGKADGVMVVGPTQVYFFDCMSILAGRFPGTSGCWPLRADPEQVASAWLNPTGSFGELIGDVIEDEGLYVVEAAAETVCETLDDFLMPLRLGLVEARGNGAGGFAPIARETWLSPGRVIDPAGRLGTDEGGTFTPDWTDIALARPILATVPVLEPAATSPLFQQTKQETRSKGGVDPTYSWEIAFNSAFLWMISNSFPHTGAELCELIETALMTIDGRAPGRDYIKKIVKGRHPDLWRFVTRKAKSDFSAVPIALKPKGGRN